MKLIPYIINLEHRSDRLQHIIGEVSKLNIQNYNIVKAVEYSPSWVGCFKSHKKCIQLAKDTNQPYSFILEDDAYFIDDALHYFNQSIVELNQYNWDMFFLGANLQTQSQKISDNLLKINGAFCAHAYIVNSKIYDYILDLVEDKPIDVYYSEIMKTYNVYMCNPIISYQLPSYSDLEGGYRDYVTAIYNNYIQYTI